MSKASGRFILAIAWFTFSFILLALPGSVLPKENWLDKIWADKWVHIILFLILVILWTFAFYKLKKKRNNLKQIFLWITILGIAYGIAMEFVQKYFISNRSFDVGDILADAVGCGIGFIISRMRYIKK